jgi:hypothetical protein
VKWFLAFAVAALAFADSARAAVLPFEATLEFRVANTIPLTIVDTGFATLNGSGGGLHLNSIAFAAGAISGTGLEPVTDPSAFPVSGLRVTAANAAGTIAATTGGALRGAVALPGILKVCLFGTGGCAAPTANISVPLTPVGQGGTALVQGVVSLTVFGAPWTTGTAAVGTITQMGYAHGPASGTSSTAQSGGSLRLVTPIFINTNIEGVMPAFAILTLHFVPEPATALLLGGGVALLCWRGRRRR